MSSHWMEVSETSIYGFKCVKLIAALLFNSCTDQRHSTGALWSFVLH